jgi:hypothetical protein
MSARIGAALAQAVQSPLAAIAAEARRIARPVIVYSIVDSNSHIVRNGTGLRRDCTAINQARWHVFRISTAYAGGWIKITRWNT